MRFVRVVRVMRVVRVLRVLWILIKSKIKWRWSSWIFVKVQ
jgi:hypothetical protein